MLRRRLERLLREPSGLHLLVLIPLAYIYRVLTALHRGFYNIGILRSRTLPRPVISVGNLTIGGAGKTPIVMWLADALVKQGIRPAILSRGYGRRGKGVRIVDPDGPWQSFGDEPLMMARRQGDIPVAVSARRYDAGLEILKDREVDLFILDDGFQHRALSRDADIVVVDGKRRFGSGRLLPSGILREPVSRLRDADLIAVTKVSSTDTAFEKELAHFGKTPVLWFDYRSKGLVPLDPETVSADDNLSSEPCLAFCGIADPDGFRESLEQEGVKVVEFITFPDHHPYSAEDTSIVKGTAREAGVRYMVTTEKDAVRWPVRDLEIPLYYLSMGTFPLQDQGKVTSIFRNLIPGMTREPE